MYVPGERVLDVQRAERGRPKGRGSSAAAIPRGGNNAVQVVRFIAVVLNAAAQSVPEEAVGGVYIVRSPPSTLESRI